jgi:hypothetical protein
MPPPLPTSLRGKPRADSSWRLRRRHTTIDFTANVMRAMTMAGVVLAVRRVLG